MRLLYLYQVGFYLQLIVSLVFIDEKLDDFYEMLTHHVITLLLVLKSYSSYYHRAGIYTFFLHDAVDIFLYWAKASYEGK
jgi:hypothetical protein